LGNAHAQGFQAGLSWRTILLRLDDVERLMTDTRIIRARAKIEATIGGARAFLVMRDRGEDLADLVWGMAGGAPASSMTTPGTVSAETAAS
jgi:DNA-3-methyladenine glycosylase I